MLENLLEENGISISLKEGTKAANTKKAKEALINSPEGKEAGLTQMSATYRIGNRNKIDKDNLDWIEDYLSDVHYEEIPQSFLNQVNKWFEQVSYIKSMIELKKNEKN